jgi:hypothetical protein
MTGVKRTGSEADHSPPSTVEVKNALNCTSTVPRAFMAGAATTSLWIYLYNKPELTPQ